MRDLHAGYQCEHVERVGSVHTSYVNKRCDVKHHERVDGKPQHLVPVKDGRVTRFMCMAHAPKHSGRSTVARQKKKDDGYGSTQEVLL